MAERLPYVEEEVNLNKQAPRGKAQVHHSIQLWNDNKDILMYSSISKTHTIENAQNRTDGAQRDDVNSN